MAESKIVLIVGLHPDWVDFTWPELAGFPGLNAEKIQSGLDADQARLQALGYDARQCLTDRGETATSVLQEYLQSTKVDCVMIGAGVRGIASNFLLFEKMINIIHQYAPQAKICFNTRPDDTAAAVQRWV